MLDQVYPVPVETAAKNTRLGCKHVLHVAQSQELKAQVFEDIRLVYIKTGVNTGLQMKYLKMYLDHSNCKCILLQHRYLWDQFCLVVHHVVSIS